MLSGRHLLVDGKNALYRAIFVKTKDSPIDVFFRIILSNLDETGCDYVHIFWDCPRSETWRRAKLPQYKAHRDDKKDPLIGEKIGVTHQALRTIIPHLGMRQYYCPKLEADDLIYSFVSTFHPTETIILSSDSDLIQIPFKFYSCKQKDPNKGYIERPVVNPIFQKSLMGDNGDNIDGYNGIGPKKSLALLESFNNFHDFLQKDPRVFLFNLHVVDLSYSPYHMQALWSIVTGIKQETTFDLSLVKNKLSNMKLYPKLHDLDWSKVHKTDHNAMLDNKELICE